MWSKLRPRCTLCIGGEDKRTQLEDAERRGGFNEKAVTYQVTNGTNAMPAFGGRLSDSDIANVATYVISAASEGWD